MRESQRGSSVASFAFRTISISRTHRNVGQHFPENYQEIVVVVVVVVVVGLVVAIVAVTNLLLSLP